MHDTYLTSVQAPTTSSVKDDGAPRVAYIMIHGTAANILGSTGAGLAALLLVFVYRHARFVEIGGGCDSSIEGSNRVQKCANAVGMIPEQGAAFCITSGSSWRPPFPQSHHVY
jgi:hypothetical protein